MNAPMPPTGEQFVIADGGTRAVVTEVGAVLRAFEVDGRAYAETFDETERPPRGSGSVLVPWPNRVRDGRWTWRGTTQQLALTEPAAGNAIHGLLRYTQWRPVERTPDSITLAAVAVPQPGWPVPVATTVRYAVGPDGLRVTHTVRNAGPEPVPFGVGAHPYPRVGEAATDDIVLTLAASTVLPLDDRQLPAGPAVPVTGDDDFRGGLPLRGRVLDAAFGGAAPAPGDDLVRHRLDAPDGAVELWADPDFRWVQVYTPDDRPGRGRVVAVEPMTCPPDALNSGQDLITLAPGETWTGSWGLRPV
ncbi:aldose 1-epimerase family protein [Pseudonocardia sp. K10HN5]|uniref:Aldose 1-epimerase family protein n=1 Tax=Pseudonocardia acidicola TaxID=2724939 RepID=A0ABX1S7H0_9PSEU|nr:aldose 1-epimerase family protein [Pseudonocardia acidicola]